MKFSRIASLCTVAALVAAGCGGDDSSNAGSGDKIVDASRTDAKKADAAVKDSGPKADATTADASGSDDTDADTDGGEDASDGSDDADADQSEAGEDAEAGDTDAGVDSGPADTGAPDTGPADTGAPDTGPADTGAPDTGPADTGAPDTGVDSGPVDAGAPDATAANDYAAAKRLVGLYAERARFRTLEKTNAYNGNAEYKVLTSTFLLATVADDPANQRVVITEQPCHVAITTNNANISETILDRIPTSTLPVTTPLAVHVASGGVINWSRAGISAPVGFHDTTPGGALPTSTTDARVFDQDNDGHPGATLSVAVTLVFTVNGDGYYVQRYQDQLAGTVTGTTFTGTNVDTSTRVFLDASVQGLKDSEISSRADTDTTSNDVKIVAVPTGTTCSSVPSAAF